MAFFHIVALAELGCGLRLGALAELCPLLVHILSIRLQMMMCVGDAVEEVAAVTGT